MEFKVLDANGVKIKTAIEGEGPLVLMVHGWPESWYSWRYQIPKIAEAGYTAAAIDVRGYGESDKPHLLRHRLRRCHSFFRTDMV